MNDFAAALRDLDEAEIRFVVVGGLAVIRHGAVRATKDVDVAVAMDPENLRRLATLIELWQATNPDGTRSGESLYPAASCSFAHPTA